MKTTRRNATRVALAAIVGANGWFVIGSATPAVADPGEGMLDDVPSTTPSTLGDVDLTELQYGDPLEALGLVQPPSAQPDGGASLAHPLAVPPGRAGVQPDLALSYDSNGGSSWVGTGWDLSVGAITVDTEFGAPRYLAAEESETYLLDGDRLFPNAIRTDLDPRLPGPRSDWVLQLEDDHDLITRHGSTPSTYCWEVADTEGNRRFYGGTPDGLGGCIRDASAILTADATGAVGGVAGDYHWALTYVEDISGNVMRFTYDRDEAVAFGQQAGGAIGVSLYLRTIEYTGFKYTSAAPDHPAYRVTFLRDGEVAVNDDDGNTATPRLDVTVDASTGEPVVVDDLLRGVQVEYLSPEFYAGTANPQLVKGWTLHYDTGPFDKSLLTSVGQYGTGGPGTEHAWHEFTWFDDVTDPATGNYVGFSDAEQWGTRSDTSRVNIAAESALGTSWRAGADGGAYIGFNPVIPSKLGSFGGSFNIAGGQTNEVSTLVDLDGDGLPDKVWANSGGTVMYRPNLGGPGGLTSGDRFGSAHTITGIDSLGRSSDIRIDLHFEAYPVVAIQVGGGFGFSFGDRYFEDVNGDGRVDFIKPGSSGGQTVFYNVLDNGIPTFVDSSLAAALIDRLEVPLDAFVSDLATAQIAEVADLLVNTSPRIDTVRRWLAPHTGRVRVQGSPTLTAGSAYRGDGAKVTVEHDDAIQWSSILNAGATSASHDLFVDVTAGEPVWFRLHVIDNAADDAVSWSPAVTYVDATDAPITAALDANGRSQVTYDAAADFTLFGRTGARTALSEPGDITVNVEVTTLTGLSDDVRVIVFHGRGTADPTPHDVLTVPQLTTGASSGSVDLTITAPATTPGDDGVLGTEDDGEENDWIEVAVRSDSPVDPTQFSVEITTTAPGFEDPDLTDVDPNNDADPDNDVVIPLDIPLVPNVQVYSRTDHTAPYAPVTSPDRDRTNDATVEVEVEGPPIDFGLSDVSSPATATIKTLDGGVVARSGFTVEHAGFLAPLQGSTTFDFTPERNTTYYVDVSVADPTVGANVDLITSTVTWRWTETEQDSDGNDVDVQKQQTVTDAGQLHWPDADGMFPSGNRGWAYAGYNADHADANGGDALVEGQFEFDAQAQGYDEDTEVPDAGDAPSAGAVKGDAESSFDSALPYIPWAGPDSDVADRWRAAEKETMNGTGTTMQADRLGADTPVPGVPATGRQAPQMLSVSGDFNFMLGLVASFSAAAGGGRDLKGYEDYNGDGYPDIRSGSEIEYTGPRGAKATTTDAGDNPFDTSLALGGGLGGSAVSISSSGGSSQNNDGGGQGSNVEPTTTKSSRGMNIGLGFSIQAQWTNPLADGEAYDAVSGGGGDAPDIQGDLDADRDIDTAAGASGTPIDRAFIDVNGDGLPDRVDTYTSGEMWVNLNLGYRFSPTAVQWSTGRTASNKDVGGSISVGFQFNAYEFGGGVAYSEGVGYSLFDWFDIDGDGVPDRMNNVGDGQPDTVFGSADGMQRSGVVYGTFPNGDVTVDAARFGSNGIDLPAGQMEVSRATGLSGGVDFTFYIGPICLVACYIVINPGIHGGYDRQSSQVQMVDMNGDGYLDAVRSTDYEHVEVRLNQRGRTNLLQTVTNPIGGQIRLDYERTGNTIVNPESMWVMTDVQVDDGRAGDGPDVQRSTYEYGGAVFDPLLRAQLGFSSIREEQLDTDGTVLRAFERDYLNGNPLEAGTLVEERTYDGAGATPVRVAQFAWEFANADPNGGAHGAHGSLVTNLPAVGTTARLVLFDTALSPRLVTDSLTQYDAEGDVQTLVTRYTYDVIGNVLTVHDENESEIDGDDTFTVITYSDCAARSGARAGIDSWVSVPQTVAVHGSPDASGPLLRFRHGGPDLCANAAPIRIAELVDADDGNGCGPLYAITELSFDTHGSYNGVAHPTNAAPSGCGDYPPVTVASATFDGCSTLGVTDDLERYCVDYVYDAHRHTDIAQVTDNHGVSSSATFDPLTGRMASRTDENGNVTTYSYDAAGRVQNVTAPREQGTGTPTVSYSYGGYAAVLDPNGAHAWATAHHRDVFHGANTIDTATFVDGMGRVVQNKRDAEVDGVAGEARIVEGAVEYDALGREVKQWYPVVETVGARALTAYNTWTSETGTAITAVPVTQPTVRTFDVYDRLIRQVLPDGSVETVAFDFDVLPNSATLYGADVVMSRTISTDPLGRATTRWLDVGGAQFRRVDGALPATVIDVGTTPLDALPASDVIQAARIAASTGTPGDITTVYDYDRLGRLVSVIDAAGARTDHAYDLQDNVTSTVTPDAGAVTKTFAPSGQLLTLSRANGTTATYHYDRDRLVEVTYSDGTPTVTYEYGAPGAAENGAGRVTRVVDGSMERTYGFDVDGNVDRETATMDEDPFGKGIDPDPPTFTTEWEYDSLGRIVQLTYPSGEDLAHDYDLGGRPARLVSQAPQHDLYDQYGNTVPRPDVEIVYVDAVRYDEFGEPTFLRTGTGVETDYEYEPTRRFLAGIDTASTSATQFDGTVSVAQPLQALSYTYDAVGNVRDVVNGLYGEPGDTAIAQFGPPPVNNVPGPSQQAYTYDGHYRITGGVGTYVDQKERRDFTYATDYGPNGNLLAKRQVTTTTSTTSKGGGKKGNPNAKKGNGSGTNGGTTPEPTCESNTGSGGGSFNQDPETTYVIAPGDLEYGTDAAGNDIHRLVRLGLRDYSYDANGNLTGWVQDCAEGTSDISRSFTWDGENRVTRIAEGNNDTDYRYNAEGARTLERGPGGTTWFVNEHWRSFNGGLLYANVFLGERMVATHRTDPQPPPPAPCVDTLENPCQCSSGGACLVTDASQCDLTATIFDPATSTCQPKEQRKLYFHHHDLQGSLRVATDEVGRVHQYVDYLPTGRPWVAGQDTIKDTPNLFAGGWTDTTYKLVNFGERWYDPREQHFLSPEPLLEEDPYAAVDDPSLLSAYTYAASNPLRFVDPDGRAPKHAFNGYELGENYEKHQRGNITISVEARENRRGPAITFGGRYGNDYRGQEVQAAFQKHADRASRFSTILSISTEDGVRKIRVFGGTVSKKNVGEPAANAAPNPAPGANGGDNANAAPAAPPNPNGAPAQPAAQAVADAGPAAGANVAAAAQGADGGPAAPPPPAADADGGNDAPAPPPPPPPPPANAAPNAPGPPDGG